MAPRPALPPLKTPKTMSFPSELYDSPIKESSGSSKTQKQNTASITPPAAYTKFLNALTPIYGSPGAGEYSPRYNTEQKCRSPRARPTSAASVPFSARRRSKTPGALPTPSSSGTPHSTAPGALQRLRRPSVLYSPATCSPQSASTVRTSNSASTSDWKRRYIESPRSEDVDYFSIQQVTIRTINYRRAPTLNAPPRGKRKPSSHGRDTRY